MLVQADGNEGSHGLSIGWEGARSPWPCPVARMIYIVCGTHVKSPRRLRLELWSRDGSPSVNQRHTAAIPLVAHGVMKGSKERCWSGNLEYHAVDFAEEVWLRMPVLVHRLVVGVPSSLKVEEK